MGRLMILPKIRDPRFITVRRGGTLQDDDHHRLAMWAADWWMTENALFLLPALRRARDLIDREYAEPLDLDAMAREAGYSRFHFARAFAAAMAKRPAPI